MGKRKCLGAHAQIVKPHTGDWGGNRQVHIAVRGGLALFEIRKRNTHKLRAERKYAKIAYRRGDGIRNFCVWMKKQTVTEGF